MAMSSSSGFEQWVYGIDRFRRGRHGKTDMRRGSSVRSDGIVLTMSLCSANGTCAICNSYQKYYNEARTHLSLHKDAPVPRAVQTVGLPLAMPVLGGLHHQYFRA
jgi:hypothetical protein